MYSSFAAMSAPDMFERVVLTPFAIDLQYVNSPADMAERNYDFFDRKSLCLCTCHRVPYR
jgi:hypothetical protein